MTQLNDAEGKFEDTMDSFKDEIPRLTRNDDILSYVKEYVKPAAYALMKALAKLAFSKETIDIFIGNRRFAAYFQLVLNHFHAILLEGNMYEDVVMTAEFFQDGEMKNGAFHVYTGLLTKIKPLFHLVGSPFRNDDCEIQDKGTVVSSLQADLKEKQTQSNKVF